jgi:hypothetical protein
MHALLNLKQGGKLTGTLAKYFNSGYNGFIKDVMKIYGCAGKS